MTKSEFKPIMQKLKIAYGEKRFPLSNEVMEVWYEFLGGFKSEDVLAAIKKHILEESYPPTIADIAQKVKEIRGVDIGRHVVLEKLYMSVVAAYPMARDRASSRDLFQSITGGDIKKASQLLTVTQNMVHVWEVSGRNDIPPLDEFLKGLMMK